MVRVKMPTGEIVDMPDQPTAEQLARLQSLQAAPAQAASPQSKPKVEPPRGVMDKATDTLMGLGEFGLSSATNLVSKPVSEVAGMAALGKELVSPTPGGGDPSAYRDYVRQQLSYEPRTPYGRAISESNLNPLVAAGKGLDWLGGKIGQGVEAGANMLGSNPNVAAGAGRATREAVNQAPGVILPALSEAKLASLPERQAAMDIKRGENLPTDIAREKAQARGIITPVESSNWISKILGETNLNRAASESAQDVYSRAIAKELGVPEGVAMTPAELEKIREERGKSYAKLKEEGSKLTHASLPPPATSFLVDKAGSPISFKQGKPKTESGFKVDPEFKQEIAQLKVPIAQKLQANPELFKSLGSTLPLLDEVVSKDVINPDIAVDSIRQLRKDANTEFKSDDPTRIEMASMRKSVADAMENMIDRNLIKAGKQGLVDELRADREAIAKTYQIEQVIDPAGNVDLRKLYNKASPATSGVMREAADYAGIFPRGARPGVSPPGFPSPEYLAMSATGDVLTGKPINSGLMGLRMLAPMAAKTGMFQTRTPSYTVRPPLRPGYGALTGQLIDDQTPPAN